MCPIATRTPVETSRSTSGRAPGTSGASVTSDDPAAGRVLPAIEIVDARRPHVRPWMRAPRTVVRGDVRPFHVDAGDGGVGNAGDDACARGKVLEGRGDEGRERARHAGAAHPLEREADVLGCQVWRVEVYAAKPVDLKVEEARKLEPHERSCSSTVPRVAGVNPAAESRSRYTVVSACVCRIDAGAIGDTGPSRHA